MRVVAADDPLLELANRHLPIKLTGPADARGYFPKLAKDPRTPNALRAAVQDVSSHHRFVCGDARHMTEIPDESVHLIVTSPPYWTLKRYRDHEAQLGHVQDYETFLDQLELVWKESFRVLAKGGRLVIVVGDVCLSRKRNGRHRVVPLHASILERCRRLGFDNLAPIIWYKIANASLEVQNGSTFLGKPYEPNAVIKNDIEFILMQRKPGAYRTPSLGARALSVIPESHHRQWFQQVWDIPGASSAGHPAPFPLELAERLVRMFSFVGDTVLDPFTGTGTTNLAASLWGRHSVGIEIDHAYLNQAVERLRERHHRLMSPVTIDAPLGP